MKFSQTFMADWRLPRRLLAIAAAALAAVAAGCGGRPESVDEPATVPAPEAGTLTITGTAATGAALSGASLSARCAVGVGSTTSQGDGTFSFTIRGGALPCVLRVDAPSGPLVSVALGSGSSAVANVTPLTHLVVAQATRQEPPAYYDLFDAAAAAALVLTPTES